MTTRHRYAPTTRDYRKLEAETPEPVPCQKGVVIHADPTTLTVTIVPISCHRWDCPECGPIKAHMWARKIAEAKPERFLTLTRNPSRRGSPRQSYKTMKAGLPRLVRAIRKRFGTFEYVAVWELHKDGQPHLHLLQKGNYVPWVWLKRALPAFGFGRVCSIEPVRSQGASARYVAKYLTKTITAIADTPWISRLVLSSRHFFPPPSPDPVDPNKPATESIMTHHSVSDILEVLVLYGGFRIEPGTTPRRITLKFTDPDPDTDTFWAALERATREY